MGQSGAGKSTLLNQIAPELDLETGVISNALGRGKHTTRHVELLPLFGGLVADTPGFGSIEFAEIESEELPELFPEFVEVQAECRFRGCMHRKEPGCKVQEELATGEIEAYRYQHYLQFLEEIENRKPKYTKTLKRSITMKISPSILSADFANLERDIRIVEEGGADYIHVDVMDGHFVPNITLGPNIVSAIRPVTKLPLDCHLMIENPENTLKILQKRVQILSRFMLKVHHTFIVLFK